MNHIYENIEAINHRIKDACDRVGRKQEDVTLIAVSKTFPADDVRTAMEAGQIHFGENRWQEAESKIPLLPAKLHWHYIGSLQRNKVRKILPHFRLIHSIDSLRLAAYTDDVAKECGINPAVLLQVNLAAELTKGGFTEEEIIRDAEELFALKNIDIHGLMTVPPPVDDPEKARVWFRGLRLLRDRLCQSLNTPLPILSMGMSSDYEVAIEEGATHIRVGSALFGKRSYAT